MEIEGKRDNSVKRLGIRTNKMGHLKILSGRTIKKNKERKRKVREFNELVYEDIKFVWFSFIFYFFYPLAILHGKWKWSFVEYDVVSAIKPTETKSSKHYKSPFHWRIPKTTKAKMRNKWLYCD